MLTATAIKNLKPKEKTYRLSDGYGLNIEVKPNGQKIWRYRFRFEKKQNMATIGHWPETSLAKAREQRILLSKTLGSGLNPNQKAAPTPDSSQTTFADVHLDWQNMNTKTWANKTASTPTAACTTTCCQKSVTYP